jgi:prefoldin subunit 5
MKKLINGTSPLGLAMIKQKNKVIAQKGLGTKAKNINEELGPTVAKQEAMIAQFKQDFRSRLAHQQKQIEALTATVQKVSAESEMNRPAPQVVNNNNQ